MKFLYNFVKLNVGKIHNGGIRGSNIVLHSQKPGEFTLKIVHTSERQYINIRDKLQHI